MSAATITCGRTIGLARNLCSTALAVGGFLAAAAALFAFSLDTAEGSRLAVSVLWTVSVVPVLPFFCAVLAMDSWSEERRTGRIDMLLSLPVRERDLIIGKFLGVFAIVCTAVVFSLLSNLVVLFFMAPSSLDGIGPLTFLPALFALFLQSALYIAASMAVSACFANAVASVTVAFAVVCAIPRGIWLAMVSWFPSGSGALGQYPLEAHAMDIAGGVVSVAVVVFYVAFTAAFLFFAEKVVLGLRFRGKGASGSRLSTAVVLLLLPVVAVAVTVLAARLDMTLDFQLGNGRVRFSQRTNRILTESRGDITATCFVPRADSRFRSVSHLLRSIARESVSQGGARIEINYVDPRWDIGAAGRLVREGVQPPAIVFSNRRRRISLPLSDGWGERSCANALLKMTVPPARNKVYWTTGHGESSFSDYGPSGMSDIARELSRDGYRNTTVDLSSEATIPKECAMIVVAGAKQEFSRAEVARLDAYLRTDGRLLVLAEGSESALLSSLIPSWGAIAKGVAAKPQRTLSGTDAVISEFGSHPVSEPLKGSQIVLERPVLFAPSAAAGVTQGADSIEFSSLAGMDSLSAAVMLERGSGAGSDTAIRPTRIAVIGDASFVRNAQLEARANANRDFFLNCVSYLSGSEAITSGGADGELFVTGLDRRGRMNFLYVSAVGVPLAVTLALLVVVWRRRFRT